MIFNLKADLCGFKDLERFVMIDMKTVTKGEEAKQLFQAGYNCAQSVLGCFYEELGLSQETALLLVSPLGGGMCRMREVCGAVSAMLIILGLADGYLPVSDKETHTKEKTRVYQTGQELAKDFREKFGSVLCSDLLAEEGNDRCAIPSERTQSYYKKRPCSDYVAYAAERINTYLREKNIKSENYPDFQEEINVK